MSKKKNTPMKSNFDVEVISLASQVKTPVFEIGSYDTFLQYGDENNIPDLLSKLYSSVPMHSAIINKKASLILGEGIVDENGEPLQAPNSYEKWDVLMAKISADIATFNGSYIKIVWERGGERVATYEHLNYNSMRLGLPSSFLAYHNTRYKDPMCLWENQTTTTESYIKPYLLYNTKYKKNEQILYIKGYNNITDYALPDYFSAIKDLDTLAEISTFHNANIHQNMQPGFKFIFEGNVPPKEEKDRIIKRTKAKYADANNAGKALFFFVPEGGKMTAEPMAVSDISKMFNLLSKDVKENILVSHQTPRKIAGIETSGSLGSGKEIIDLQNLYKSNVIQPMRNTIIDALTPLIGEFKFNDKSNNLLNIYSLNDLKGILTVDELRELLSYEALKTPINNE